MGAECRHRHRPGALVIGASYRALSVVRSLGRHRIPTWVVRTDEHSIACWSRYCARRFTIRTSPEELVARLIALADQYGLSDCALIPTCDDEVELFSARDEQLRACFRVAVPPPGVARWALDKSASYALAADHGVDVPRTWLVSSSDDLDNADIVYPAIVKPTFRRRELTTTAPKAWRADDRVELKRVYRRAAELMRPEQLMIQELIPGGGEHQLSYAALCRDGAVVASMAARRLRQWPPQFGMASTFVETIDDVRLAEAAERLLTAMRFTGIVELEFKRDPRDGRLALLDVNPRSWGWISVGPSAGVDFSYLHWRMLMGKEIPRAMARPGVRWVRMSTDIAAAAAKRGSGELSWRKYLWSLRPHLACAIFASDDPVPAVVDAPILAAISARRRADAWRSRVRRSIRAPEALPSTAAESGAPRALLVLENSSVPADRRVWQEALSLHRAGWEVTVLAPHAWRSSEGARDEVLEGVRIRRFRLRPAEQRRLGHLSEYAAAMWRVWDEIRDLARDHSFDVIQACNPPDFLLVAAFGQRRRGTRLIFDHHDLAPEMYTSRPGGRSRFVRRGLLALERLSYTLADVALVTNGSVGRIAVERDRMNPEDVFVVRNGPVLDRFTPVTPDRSLARGRQHLLVYVGLMGPQDGVDHALHALSHLLRRRQDWHAIFIGTGEMLSKLKRLASELRLDDRVEFRGYQYDPEVRRAISSADVCLAPDPRNPYTDRSTLVKVAEYMALARPLVSFDLTESRVTAGDAALFAPRDDDREFADCIDRLLDDPALRRRLGAAGRARVEREFAWEHSERALLAAYQRALGRFPHDLPSPQPATATHLS